MKREETAGLIAVLSAAFPHVTVTKETMTVYHEALQDLDHLSAKEAVRDILLTAEWFPPPATIRRKVAERAGVLAPTPAEAWLEVMRQIEREGLRGSPVFSHPAIETVVKSLGWWNICMSDMPDTIRAHFLKSYETARTAMDTATLTSTLDALPVAPRRALEAVSE